MMPAMLMIHIDEDDYSGDGDNSDNDDTHQTHKQSTIVKYQRKKYNKIHF